MCGDQPLRRNQQFGGNSDGQSRCDAPEAPGPPPRPGPVLISEIMYHPTTRVDGKDLEFIELFNSNPYFEDISGFRLTGEIDFTFPSNTALAARGYLVVAPSPADVQNM